MTPTAAPAAPLRPAFRDGQVLRADDLRAEAAAVVAAARRHQQFAHRSGVVGGLWLDANLVTPGMALDAAGRTILVPQSCCLPVNTESGAELWIAYLEEDQRPNRTVERYELLWETAGRYDPTRPGAHPLGAVFLGTPGSSATDYTGRVYVGAVGARVESASGKARLLLGPETPGDLRLFAVGTPAAAPGEYRDHLAIDSTGAVRFNDPISIAQMPDEKGNAPPVAVVAVGLRAVEFQTTDILDSAGLWSAAVSVLAFPKEPPAADRLCPRLASLFNATITDAEKDTGSQALEALVRKAGAAFRPETVRLLLARDAGTHRADPRRLARLLLEDAFPFFLKRLPAEDDGPLGVGFAGLRPTPTAALPGCVYLAAADKTASKRELRFEVAYPGKDNNPERYMVAIGTVGADPDKPTQSAFTKVLTADASGTVTIYGDLRVYTKKPESATDHATGLIAQIEKPAAPGDLPGKPAGLGLVSPLDLSLEGVEVARPDPARIEVKDGLFFNTGGAEVVNVQLIATVFATDKTAGFRPETTPLLRKLTVGPGAKVKFTESTGGPLVIPIRDAKLKTADVTLVLSVYGHGPGFLLLSGEQDFPPLVVPPV